MEMGTGMGMVDRKWEENGLHCPRNILLAAECRVRLRQFHGGHSLPLCAPLSDIPLAPIANLNEELPTNPNPKSISLVTLDV